MYSLTIEMVYDSTSPLGTEPSRYHSDDILTGTPVCDFPQEPQLCLI